MPFRRNFQSYSDELEKEYEKSEKSLIKNCFESFYLPVIVRQCLGINTDMYCMHFLLSYMPVPTIQGEMDLFLFIGHMINEFVIHRDLSDFESEDDAVTYRTTHYTSIFELCCLLFVGVGDFTNVEEVKMRMNLITKIGQQVGVEHNRYVCYFNRNA